MPLIFYFAILLLLVACDGESASHNNETKKAVGDQIDTLNGVAIYFNGHFDATTGRHLSEDGYNFGLKYQCVEFVKRYYFERYDHRMPNTYGHAKDFFDPTIVDGDWNTKRAMLQFTNGSVSKPKPDDLIVFGPWLLNPYGHVAIVAKVGDDFLEIAQQNTSHTRQKLSIKNKKGKWFIQDGNVIGWLRLLSD